MGNPEGLDIASALIARIDREPDAAHVGVALGTIWHGIERALSPILGKRGVAALYHRSLHVAGATYPWLDERHDGVPLVFDVETLKSAVVQQSAADAVAGGTSLILAFCELLASLIGPSLTERLLRPLLVDALRDPTVSGPIE